MSSHFPFTRSFPVRGTEIDAWGHVNNAVYLQWLEDVRWEMYRAFDFSLQSGDVLPVIRHVELDYRAECLMGDEVEVTLWPRHAGTTSFKLGMSVRIAAADDAQRVGQVAAVAQAVLVCTGKDRKKTVLPAHWRAYFPDSDPGPEPPVSAVAK
jgi:YbgC/YbaW family acyl-CoA thioester hydrolase